MREDISKELTKADTQPGLHSTAPVATWFEDQPGSLLHEETRAVAMLMMCEVGKGFERGGVCSSAQSLQQ